MSKRDGHASGGLGESGRGVDSDQRRRSDMIKKQIAAISVVFVLATTAAAPTALAEPNNVSPDRPGACNMFQVGNSTVGFAGMDNSAHGQGFGYDNMVELVTASGCL